MARRRRCSGVRAALAATILLTAVWAASAWCTALIAWRGLLAGVEDGRIGIAWPWPGEGVETRTEVRRWRAPVQRWGFQVDLDAPYRVVAGPLWMPALGAAGLLLVAWKRSRCSRPPAGCPACGYDLSGLAPGAACPECGRC